MMLVVDTGVSITSQCNCFIVCFLVSLPSFLSCASFHNKSIAPCGTSLKRKQEESWFLYLWCSIPLVEYHHNLTLTELYTSMYFPAVLFQLLSNSITFCTMPFHSSGSAFINVNKKLEKKKISCLLSLKVQADIF